MTLLKLAALALLLFAFVGAAFETLGPVAVVPAGIGAFLGVRQARRREPVPVPTRIRVRFDAAEPEPPTPLTALRWPG